VVGDVVSIGATVIYQCTQNNTGRNPATEPLYWLKLLENATFQTQLDGKAAFSHTHSIANVTGLQTALDGKAASSHNHSASQITSGTLDAARIPEASTAEMDAGTNGKFPDAATVKAYVDANAGGTFTAGLANLPIGTVLHVKHDGSGGIWWSNGGTRAGGGLRMPWWDSGTLSEVSTALAGTWQNVGGVNNALNTDYIPAQRIA
jgi:hypothetical protein